MADTNTTDRHSRALIDDIEPTTDKLTGRAGLSLFTRYLRGIEIFSHLDRLFGSLRQSGKGQPIPEIFKQLFCFFLDGTSRHLVYFDALKQDEGYAGAIETGSKALLSSHAVKRFFGGFYMDRIGLFRRLLQQLFLWRRRLEPPPLILLGLDTMVMDNDEAEKRHGAAPTYKRVKGFQPLQVTWDRYVIDAVFRGGDKHSNHSDTAPEDAPSSDPEDSPALSGGRAHHRAGGQRLFRSEADGGLGGTGGRLPSWRASSMTICRALSPGSGNRPGGTYQNGDQEWRYVELGDRRGNWKKFRRALFCQPLYEDRQRLLEFARPDQILYTNLGCGSGVDEQLRAAGLERWLEAEALLEGYHGRGADELVHRALKDFASQTLPFKRFPANAAFYYTMRVAFFLYESFKQDVCDPVVPLSCYATTLRRRLLDVAGKIVRHAGQILLKVTTATWEQLQIRRLWEKSGNPPAFGWT